MKIHAAALLLMLALLPAVARAADVLEQLQEVEEDLSGDSDFSNWVEQGCGFRRLVTLVAGPGERPEVVAITGLSPAKIRQSEQLGAGIVARTAGGEKLATFYDAKADLLFVQLLAQHRKRDDATICLYYGGPANKGDASVASPLAKPASDASLKVYTAFLWPEEIAGQKAGEDSAITKRAIERYQSLIVVEPAAHVKAAAVPEANCGTIARFADHPDGIEFAPVNIQTPGKSLVRIRWHSPTPIKVGATVDFAPSLSTAKKIHISGHKNVELEVQGEGFFWTETVMEIHGITPRISLDDNDAAGKLGVDFIAITPANDPNFPPNWHPDYDSLSGPLWVRFRLPAAPGAPPAPSISLIASHTTYSVNGVLSDPDGEWFPNFWFKLPGLHKLAPKRLIKAGYEPGKWGPWGQLRERGSFTWFETLTIAGPPQKEVELQFAFKPYEGDVFRQERITCVGNRAKFRMPMTPNDYNDAYRFAHGYAALINERLAAAAELGLDDNHQLKKIAFSVFEIQDELPGFDDLTLALFKRIGFNGVDVPNEKIPQLYAKHGMVDHMDHSWTWDYIECDWAALAGKTYAEKMDSYRKNVVANIRKMHVRQFPDDAPFNILGDEIGPAAADYSMNDKGLEALFIQWLTEQNLKPDFFGIKEWSDFRWPVAPLGLAAAAKARQAEFDRLAKDALKKADIEAKKGSRPPVGDIGLDEADDAKIKEADKKEKELLAKTGDKKFMSETLHQRAQDASPIIPEPKSLGGRHLRYYMRRFQSDFTGRVYNAFAEGFYKESKNPRHTVSGPNFQADPAQNGQMWDGGLDLFTYGRTAGVHSMIQIEDWVGPTGFMNCAYAGALIRAACRTSDAVPACLITGGRARPKILAWLSQGMRKFDSYTYGPLYCIGPVYADDPISIENIGQSLAEISRTEDDILACKPDNKVALLVANTSETIVKNSGKRIRVFADATNAGFGVDIISEDDCVLDKLHEKYGVVLLADQGVRREVQEALAKWIAGGGRVIMLDGSAAFDQFEEPCDVLTKAVAADRVVKLETREERNAFQAVLSKLAGEAKITPIVTENVEGVTVWSTKGEKRQTLFVLKSGDDEHTEVTLHVPHATQPREVFSAKYGVIKSEFKDGVTTFTLKLPPPYGAAKVAEMPNTDIVVIRD